VNPLPKAAKTTKSPFDFTHLPGFGKRNRDGCSRRIAKFLDIVENLLVIEPEFLLDEL
jgi:hypothetical protein